ncbi:MAG: hypothetical protein H7X70_01230, partial [Candidatus Kapabacteria bacterium]|nr:hypothetical protein [Candidatus Kapabacteria bacterium]
MTILLLSLVCGVVQAQIEYSTWVFGSDAAVTFNNGSGGILARPSVVDGLKILVREGSMAYTHPCEQNLSLYAMGETAYDGMGKIIPFGDTLSGGASSTQGGIFVRDLQRPFSVYLFITPDLTDISATQTSQYTLNRAVRSNTGQWSLAERDIRLDPRPGSERITATHDAAGTGYWVLTQFTDSSNFEVEFVAHHVTPTGIDPVTSVSRFPRSQLPHQAGAMKFSPDGLSLAMVNVNEPVMGVYDFDPSTGQVSNQRFITLAVPANWSNMSLNYGVTFTMSGSYIYTSVRATPVGQVTQSFVVRFRSSLASTSRTLTPEFVCATPLFNTYPVSLQLGPNGMIYFPNSEFLGEIATPDAPIVDPVMIQAGAYSFPGPPHARLGMPSCMESTYLRPNPDVFCDVPLGTIRGTDTCEGGCITITRQVTNNPTRWEWSFVGGRPTNSFDSIPPRVCYDRAGKYVITLTVSNDAGSTLIKDTIIIHPIPVVNAGPDVTTCTGGNVRLRATGADIYIWQPAALLDDATLASPLAGPITVRTVFIVTGSSTFGCVDVDTVVVTPGDLVGTITPDTTICGEDSVEISAAGGTQCRWLDDSTLTSFTRVVSPKDTTTFTAVVSDGGCIDTVSTTINIAKLSTLIASNDTVVCQGASVSLRAFTDAAFVRWTPAAAFDDSTSLTPVAVVVTKSVFVVTTSNAAGCSISDTVIVDVQNGFVDARDDTTVCAGQLVELRARASGVVTWRELGS